MLLFLTLLGSIVLSLYGMKVMSQGILKVTGSHLRASLRDIGHNRLRNLWNGTWITALLQSSSAVTLMAVSLVNAGMLSLSRSIALMMGANVGTTITAWIIVVLGYRWPLQALALPVVLLALPFFYATRSGIKTWGEVLMGAALHLLGFTTFIQLMPEAADMPAVATVVSTMASWGYGSIVIFVIIGILITLVFRSSSATILIAMALLVSGWLEFPMAASLVMGDNVGTTLTGVIASRHANTGARRAAMSHLLFNLVGLCWALPLIYPISECLWQVITWGSGIATAAGLACDIALFHTLFNLVTALLLIGFIPRIKYLLSRMLPVSEADDTEAHLHYIQGGLLSTAELSVEEARKETALFGQRCQQMLQLTTQFIHMAPENAAYQTTFARIGSYEQMTDRLELEIVRYLGNIDRAAVSAGITDRIRAIIKIVDELESIGDACYNMARAVVRKGDHKLRFIAMQQQNIDRMLQYTQSAITLMVTLLQKPEMTEADMQRAYNIEDDINAYRTLLRDQNIGHIQSGYYTYQSGTIYMDLINGCEKIGDYIINVLEAHAQQN